MHQFHMVLISVLLQNVLFIEISCRWEGAVNSKVHSLVTDAKLFRVQGLGSTLSGVQPLRCISKKTPSACSKSPPRPHMSITVLYV